jgi:hypothetical protein
MSQLKWWKPPNRHAHCQINPSVMQNTILMAVPLFIFMGIVLQKTKLAEQLLEAMGDLFGNVRGGLAVSTGKPTISNNKVVPNMTKPII